METQSGYKRTMAGSVGAGMGAIFNASGRTYYILEHKTTSKYHSAGEQQKIIIDQVELGRDPSCQVRFDDDSCPTVSRKHAAIVRDGQNWQLIHLSGSNPTIVNGRTVQGSYYLQSGDEIQLSANGPRMGFIVPQGKQALTSSIKLTERMNLFRQQALAPYRRAIWTLATLLLLTIVGFGIWTYMLNKDLNTAREELASVESTIESYDAQIDALMVDADANKTTIDSLKRQKARVVNRYITTRRDVIKNDPALLDELKRLREEKFKDDPIPIIIDPVPPTPDDTTPIEGDDIREYYGSIYRIIVENITIEDRNGVSHPSNISTSEIDCGSGFVLPNGGFVTARQNIQPWIYVDGNSPSDIWRRRLAAIFALGNKINISYSAYSTDGPAQRLQFSSRDFSMPTGGDIVTAHITITEEDIVYFESLGLTINRKQLLKEGLDIQHATASARAYAVYPGTGRAGIPIDAGASNSIAGGTPLDIVYYETSNVQNLAGAANYFTANTQKADNRGGTIRLQSGPGSTAFGAPVFITEKSGKHMVVGVYVGNSRVVPVHRLQ